MSWTLFSQILILMIVAYVLVYVSMHAYIEKKSLLEITKNDSIRDMIRGMIK